MKLLKLTSKKCLSDESVLKKIERFSKQGVERDFFVDGKKIAKIIPRLTVVKDPQYWLSMEPNPLRWYSDNYGDRFGELNGNNDLHGRGIRIWYDYNWIGYYKNGDYATGNFIHIYSFGEFRVGEYYS